MTEIQNSKPQHHLKKESQICLGHWILENAYTLNSARSFSPLGN